MVSLPLALVVWLLLPLVLSEFGPIGPGPSIGSSDSSRSPGVRSSVDSSVGLAADDSLIILPSESVG